MRFRYYTADVFTRETFGGNQLAVVMEAQGLDGETMQTIAREFNYSETVFVLPPGNPAHTAKLRIFTPGRELPFAGHPTVGTAYLLVHTGAVSADGSDTRLILEEGVGPVPVRVYRDTAGQVESCELSVAQLPEFGPPAPAREAIAGVLGLAPTQLLDGDLAPIAVSCGVPFLLVAVEDSAAVRQSRPDLARWSGVLGDYWATEALVYTPHPDLPDCDLHGRMYAPAMGIPEDPATGAAAAALAGFLGRRAGDGDHAWVLAQGVEMGRPSRLSLAAEVAGGAVSAVRVGGASVAVCEGWISVP